MKTSPKSWKSGTPGGARRGHDPRHPDAEERLVDVPRRVDPEPVDLVARDPRGPQLRQPAHHLRLLGEEVVEPEEVALLEAELRARGEVDVAAVVVGGDVVQPGRLLQLPVAGEEARRPREAAQVQAREGAAAGVAGRVEDAPVAVAVRDRPGPGRAALREDHVRGVVDDDVEVDLQPEPVRAVDERGEVGLGAEVRVDGREVEAPVAVVAGRARDHRLLLHRRRHPDRGEAEVADAREPVPGLAAADEPLQVAAVVVAGGGRVVAGDAARAGEPAEVVGRVARSRTGPASTK